MITSVAAATGGGNNDNNENYGVSKAVLSSHSMFSYSVTTSLIGGRGGDNDDNDNGGVP